MKTIIIERGAQKKPLKATSGDLYDSIITVKNEKFETIHRVEYVNTDPSVSCVGCGIIAAGDYFGIVGIHRKRIKAIFVTTTEPKTKWDKLPEKIRWVPSKVPNKNWKGAKKLLGVNIHDGGLNNDWSEGCITIPTNLPMSWRTAFSARGSYYKKFIDLFEYNEIVKIKIVE